MNANKIEKLKQQRKQLDARIQKLSAAESHRDRKRDTRRKILIGSWYLSEIENNREYDLEQLKQKLDSYLTRNTDRILFDLPLLDKSTAKITEEKKEGKRQGGEETMARQELTG